MAPKLPGTTDNTNLYPDILKLKEKYSPQKRIPPPSRGPSASFSKNYKVFATAPKRNGTRNITSLNGNVLFANNEKPLVPAPQLSRNSSPEIRSDDSMGSTGSRRAPNSSLSPIRRSGSPIRRRHISEIEQEVTRESQKRIHDSDSLGVNKTLQSENMATEIQPTKRPRVSFNDEVQYDNTFTTSDLNDNSSSDLRNNAKSMVRNGSTSNKGTLIESVNMAFAQKGENEDTTDMNNLKKILYEVNSRLEIIEATQRDTLDVIRKSSVNSEVIDRVNHIQESMTRMQNFLGQDK